MNGASDIPMFPRASQNVTVVASVATSVSGPTEGEESDKLNL
jgi:hypothetical protein